MTRFARTLRQTLTIARRDFIATVFTPVFLLFLFAPVLMGALSGIAGLGAASAADGGRDRTRMVAIVPPDLARPIAEADTRLRGTVGDDSAPPGLTTLAPHGDPADQARAAFRARDYDAVAVLYGPLAAPHILFTGQGRAADYLATLAQVTLAAERLGGKLPAVAAIRTPYARPQPREGRQHQAAFFAVFGVFFLTLFLATQVIGTMAEERNNKVIEVLAAAVPLESVFLGKLLGMFGVALLFIAFWGGVLTQIGHALPPATLSGLAELRPAVGLPLFALLFATYFTMAYLLLGSVFLAVGAQASTPREIQMLSLPITVVQIGMFALASAAARAPDGWIAKVAELFPLSSPFAMAAQAANKAALWPHLAAIAWQLLWVTLVIRIGAGLFRRGVLQSGGGRPWWRRAAA